MRGPEFSARTLRPASQRSFIAIPPPAPVPTTIASYTFVATENSPLVCNLECGYVFPLARFLQMSMFRIIGMAATRHAGPNHSQTGIAKTFQSDFCRVITDNGVIAHQLKEFTTRFCGGLEFSFVGNFLK